MLRAKGIVIQDGPRDHRDGSRSFYFEDPDGNSIQILWDPLREKPLNTVVEY
ncbi:MAG: VOC family protein [Candidatus Methylomirabilales bacterium]